MSHVLVSDKREDGARAARLVRALEANGAPAAQEEAVQRRCKRCVKICGRRRRRRRPAGLAWRGRGPI